MFARDGSASRSLTLVQCIQHSNLELQITKWEVFSCSVLLLTVKGKAGYSLRQKGGEYEGCCLL